MPETPDPYRSVAADLTVLSLGAGVQSTTLALLAVEGTLPKPDIAIFADTGWEPAAVYEHLQKLTLVVEAAGIQVVTVSAGNLRDDVLSEAVPGLRIPAFIVSPNSSAGGGFLRRQCTQSYKLDPIRALIRKLLGVTVSTRRCNYCNSTGWRVTPLGKSSGSGAEGVCSVCRGTGSYERVGPVRNGKVADNWIGFSTDEMQRVSPSRVPYTRSVFPLLDLEMSRKDCERFLSRRGWSTTKSACIGCPFHGNRAWRELRDTNPTEWADAVAFDRDMRLMPGTSNRREATAFLHSSRVPLDEAPIDRVSPREQADAQGDMLDAIAELGDPDGCSPYGCRSGEPVAS